jgi:hypothetical protein
LVSQRVAKIGKEDGLPKVRSYGPADQFRGSAMSTALVSDDTEEV